MKSVLAPTIAMAVGLTGPVFAAMQGQGAGPEGKEIPEYEEKKPGGYNYRINEIDKDADRSISRKEARVNRHLFEQFDEIDKNNDGKLDRAELRAFVDADAAPPAASRAKALEATVGEIVENKEAFVGQQVMVRGKVAEVHSPHAMVIRGEGPVFGLFAEELTVLSRDPLPYTSEQGEGFTVQVTGTVREVSATEIERQFGPDLVPDLEVGFEGKNTVLVADSVAQY